MNLEDLPITHTNVVPESWLDEMGHMNVMWYTHLFSNAVHGFFSLFGFTGDYMRANQKGTFALELHVRYLAEVRVGQRVTMRSRAVARSAKRLHYMQFMYNEDRGVLSATGELVSAHVDMTTRRQDPMPEQLTRAYDEILAKHQALPWAAPVCGTMRA